MHFSKSTNRNSSPLPWTENKASEGGIHSASRLLLKDLICGMNTAKVHIYLGHIIRDDMPDEMDMKSKERVCIGEVMCYLGILLLFREGEEQTVRLLL